MQKRNRKFGDWGERLAEDFLRRHGYEVMDKNFQKRCGEIDIICQKDDILHFIEVKTRTEASTQVFGPPEEAVTKTKQQKIIQTAITFLAEKNYEENKDWRIDVVSIVYYKNEHKASINFIQNAFGES
ncbi:MAG: YraN family protein [Candidatus Pacebacteria bacterium]|jgi:putative endonuclease|nr:YraN family protein [Candidatus Paceibacterota bacterium]